MRYVLWGSAGHAKVLADLLALRGWRVIALFDNDPQTMSVLPGVPLYYGGEGFSNWSKAEPGRDEMRGLAAIGGTRGRDRLAIHELFRQHGLAIEAVAHPQASVSSSATVGAGTQILAQAVVAADARIGDACIVNHRANVDHDCLIGNGVHLAPGSTLCGCVAVDDNVMIGAGAVVLPRLTIGKNTIVGAGAVVTHDLPPGVVAVGIPARVIRKT
jgi:sugar O-acyltransferase (sialic acid O-acetyltransferase NeuD family)